MSSGVPSINVLTGSYQPTVLEKPIEFTAINSDNSESVMFTFTGATQLSRQLSNVGNGGMFHVTKDSFNDFKSSVLNKNNQWKAVIFPSNMKVLIHGTWSSKQATVGGIRRARSSKSSKPTKRRRSRRVYRKPKKN